MAMPSLIRTATHVKKQQKAEASVPKKVVSEKKPVVRLKDSFTKYHSVNSLSHLLKDNEKTVAEPDLANDNKPATPFSQDQMAELWKSYVSKNIEKKDRSLF